VPRYAIDPAEAKRLLRSGLDGPRRRRGARGTRRPPVPAFTIRNQQGTTSGSAIAEIVQQRLKDVGVKVEIQTIDWASFIKEFVKPRKFDAIVLGLGFGCGSRPVRAVALSQTGRSR
jgi:peptide/nickel transport system substrate-binding protein